MFSITFSDTSNFKKAIEVVSSILSETLLKIIPNEGFRITAMDLSHICLVNLFISQDDCSTFEAEEESKIGINLGDFNKILKRCNAKDSLTLTYDNDERKLIIKTKAPSAKKSKKFQITSIELEDEEINLDSLLAMEFTNKCVIDSDLIDEAIKDAEIFSEVLSIQISDQKISLSTSGQIGDMEFELDPEELISSEFTGDSLGIFSIAFLKNIIKTSSISKNISLGLQSEAPFFAQFNTSDKSSIIFFLAPRVEEDDDGMYDD